LLVRAISSRIGPESGRDHEDNRQAKGQGHQTRSGLDTEARESAPRPSGPGKSEEWPRLPIQSGGEVHDDVPGHHIPASKIPQEQFKLDTAQGVQGHHRQDREAFHCSAVRGLMISPNRLDRKAERAAMSNGRRSRNDASSLPSDFARRLRLLANL